MKQPNPVELLQQKLLEYKHSLEKSKDLYNKGEIDLEMHLLHKNNLESLILNYEGAITTLLTNG